MIVDFYQLSLMPLPTYIANTSEIMCDFAENKSFVCLVCNMNYMNYRCHIKTLRHRRNIIRYLSNNKTEEEINKMEVEY